MYILCQFYCEFYADFCHSLPFLGFISIYTVFNPNIQYPIDEKTEMCMYNIFERRIPMKLLFTTFNEMDRAAYRLLNICLGLILASLLGLCGYLTTAPADVLFSLWIQRYYISECALGAITVSFGGVFLLDWARKKENG